MTSRSNDHVQSSNSLIPAHQIEQLIHLVRGHRVLLDSDLAAIYGVPTWRFNEQIKRNRKRFPSDFTFQLTKDEYEDLRSQTAISKRTGRGGRRYLPYVFTEHGAIMAASVLNSEKAVEMSVFVVRAFVRLRGLMIKHRELARRLDELENEYDHKFRVVFEAIRQLMREPVQEKKRIGFTTEGGVK
jgi:hypothetical protein